MRGAAASAPVKERSPEKSELADGQAGVGFLRKARTWALRENLATRSAEHNTPALSASRRKGLKTRPHLEISNRTACEAPLLTSNQSLRRSAVPRKGLLWLSSYLRLTRRLFAQSALERSMFGCRGRGLRLSQEWREALAALLASALPLAAFGAPAPPTQELVVVAAKTPKVIASYPSEGQTVPGGTVVLKVVFDQPMQGAAWAYGPQAGERFPDCLDRPRLLEDRRTFVLLCSASLNATLRPSA